IGVLFDKWCQASKANTFKDLRELILLEEFKKKCLPDRIVVYLNEQKVTTLEKAAVCADEYNLTHKGTFNVTVSRNSNHGLTSKNRSPKPVRKSPPTASSCESRKCFYCHEPGHLIAACPLLKRKSQHNQHQTKSSKAPAGVGLIKTTPPSENFTEPDCEAETDPLYQPFISKGYVSLTGEEKDKVPITILRDTGAYIILSWLMMFCHFLLKLRAIRICWFGELK
ncbi:hypothetical protein LDENG_00257520, partial [Lucifuga dentata]